MKMDINEVWETAEEFATVNNLNPDTVTAWAEVWHDAVHDYDAEDKWALVRYLRCRTLGKTQSNGNASTNGP